MWLAFFWERNPVKTFPMRNVIGVFLAIRNSYTNPGEKQGGESVQSGGGPPSVHTSLEWQRAFVL